MHALNTETKKKKPKGDILGGLTAVDLVRLVHTVVVSITHPLGCNAAPISTAMLFCEIAIWRKGNIMKMGNMYGKPLDLGCSQFQLKTLTLQFHR